MKASQQSRRVRRRIQLALPLAFILIFLLPGIASAHAILIKSDPAKDSTLNAAPAQVRMWFTEDLNPAFSTAVVVNGENQRVDKQDAHVSSSDSKEMDVSLQDNLPPGVYVVVWRSDSNDDGHILRGSFIFSVAGPDGTVPRPSGNVVPGQNVLGGGNLTGLYTGQMDGPTFFNLVMITLVELAAVFWVGAQLWLTFVLQLVPDKDTALTEINQRIQQRFDRRFSIITLLILLLSNVGALIGQALTVTGGDWAGALSPQLLTGLVSNGRFGTYWTLREITIIVALLVAAYTVLVKNRPQVIERAIPTLNLILGLILFIAISMSSHASAVSGNTVIFAVMIDWLHLLAAAAWVGGMMYIAAVYLPILKNTPIAERAHSLIRLLAAYSPLAIAGVIIMAITGPFSATFHMDSWAQLLDTAYGRALTIKVLLVGALLITSAIHVFFLRPRLAKEYKKYSYALDGVQFKQAQQVKLREKRLEEKSKRLTNILRWEPLLGIAVLVCVGLMNVFAGTLSPTATAQQQQGSNTAPQPFNTTAPTTDGKFTVRLNISPNRFGTNVFTVTVIDNSTKQPTTSAGVIIYTTMLDMDMGTDNNVLQPDGKGHFSGSADLGMSGNWQVRIQVRTPDQTIHETKNIHFFTPF